MWQSAQLRPSALQAALAPLLRPPGETSTAPAGTRPRSMPSGLSRGCLPAHGARQGRRRIAAGLFSTCIAASTSLCFSPWWPLQGAAHAALRRPPPLRSCRQRWRTQPPGPRGCGAAGGRTVAVRAAATASRGLHLDKGIPQALRLDITPWLRSNEGQLRVSAENVLKRAVQQPLTCPQALPSAPAPPQTAPPPPPRPPARRSSPPAPPAGAAAAAPAGGTG